MFVAHTPLDLENRPRAVALGTFDGVHVGHRELVARAVRSPLRSTVITFHPHPTFVVGGGVELLSSLDRRLELLEATGVDDVLVHDFTPAVARLSAEAWAASVLAPIGTRRVVIGENFRFGYKRGGDAATLRALGFDVLALPLLSGMSSSRVRRLVAAGRLSDAERCLGRPFEVEGVVSPARAGTARLHVDTGMVLPPAGVYDGRLDGREIDVLLRADGAALLDRAPEYFAGSRVRVTVRERTRAWCDVGVERPPVRSGVPVAGV